MNDYIRGAIFGNSLIYVDILMKNGVGFDAAHNCLDLFPQKSDFGDGSRCSLHGDVITVTLGKDASILPGQPLIVNTDQLTLGGIQSPQGCQLDCPLYSLENIVQVPIAEPLEPVPPSIIIESSGAAVVCDSSVNISVVSVSGVGDRPISYKWITADSKFMLALFCSFYSLNRFSVILARILFFVTILFRALITKNFTICCEVCNFASLCTRSAVVPVIRSNRSKQFSLTVCGIPTRPIPSVRLTLRALPTLTNCDASASAILNEFDYEWYINETLMCNEDVCQIPPFTFQPNQAVSLRVFSTYRKTGSAVPVMNTTYVRNFIVGMEPLILVLGSLNLSAPISQEILIDGSESRDPNTADGLVQQQWTCFNLSSRSECSISKAWQIDWNSSILRIPAYALQPALCPTIPFDSVPKIAPKAPINHPSWKYPSARDQIPESSLFHTLADPPIGAPTSSNGR
uniref:MAM domain-containing protein n=1 Tax=Ascaris lumbricoides TaxID=6252 RepID=A0A0M3IPL8_ASCLU